MQTIFYPGYDRQPCQAFYGIANHRDQKMADIVLINSPRLGPATSLINTQEGRDSVLNRILANDLLGVSPKYVRFFVLIDPAVDNRMHGIELPIRLNFEDYKKNGHPYEVERIAAPTRVGRFLNLFGLYQLKFWVHDRHLVGGCADFRSDFEQRRLLPPEEMSALCAAVGYQRAQEGLPTWLTDLFSENSHSV